MCQNRTSTNTVLLLLLLFITTAVSDAKTLANLDAMVLIESDDPLVRRQRKGSDAVVGCLGDARPWRDTGKTKKTEEGRWLDYILINVYIVPREIASCGSLFSSFHFPTTRRAINRERIEGPWSLRWYFQLDKKIDRTEHSALMHALAMCLSNPCKTRITLNSYHSCLLTPGWRLGIRTRRSLLGTTPAVSAARQVGRNDWRYPPWCWKSVSQLQYTVIACGGLNQNPLLVALYSALFPEAAPRSSWWYTVGKGQETKHFNTVVLVAVVVVVVGGVVNWCARREGRKWWTGGQKICPVCVLIPKIVVGWLCGTRNDLKINPLLEQWLT